MSKPAARKKLLLLGRSGSGKTSMRAIIFKSQLAADSRRLGATIDVESSEIKFLGGLRLDLWDCGGQDSFMDSHLSSQSSTIFRGVESLIYIFDVGSLELFSSDLNYFIKCLLTLVTHSVHKQSTIFILLHKMDLVEQSKQATILADFKSQLITRAQQAGYTQDNLNFFPTSIWNETLYKAWSIIITHLMPSLSSLKSHLNQFLIKNNALEVVLFERTTFLVISSVTNSPSSKKIDSIELESAEQQLAQEEEINEDWDKRRFERISTMVKAFKIACQKIRAPFAALTIATPNYTAVLDILTNDTYILVVANHKTQPSIIESNIKQARPHFSKLEAIA